MTQTLSTLGLATINITNLTDGQNKLGILNQQLATGIKSQKLIDYTSSEAKLLMDFNNSISSRKSFLAVINTISTRLQVYDKSLTGIEKTAAETKTALLSAGTYNPDQNDTLIKQIQSCMSQVAYYLNQKVGDRYIFSGSRYYTAPVNDITLLPSPPSETPPYISSGYAVPAYDADYDPLNPDRAVPQAHVKDSVAIDTTQRLTYGITSNEEGFQKLIMGLRWAYAATQDVDNYSSYMSTASDLITEGLSEIRGIHANVSGSNSTLEQTKDLHDNLINSITGQIDDIQKVDVTEVAVKINTFQAQLEASYAATARMSSLSLLKYL